MQFGRIWAFHGTNHWADFPVLEVEVDLGEDDRFRLVEDSVAWDRFLRELGVHTLNECDKEPLHANLADLLLETCVAWQRKLGESNRYARIVRTSRSGYYRVIQSYEEEPLARAWVQKAVDYLENLVKFAKSARNEAERTRHVFLDVETLFSELGALAYEVRLGPSTRSLVEAARRRNIPVRRLNAGSLVLLGWGVRQKRIWTAETDDASALAETIAQDKQLTRNLLRAICIPAPYGRPVKDAEDARAAAQEIGYPVVVKPQYGNQGRGVATNLRTPDQLLQAYQATLETSPYVMVESYVTGLDHRLLVVGDRLVAAALREPAHVVGDGVSTIDTLIEDANRDPRRSDGHGTSLSFIKIDAIALGVLAEQGFTPLTVPALGQKVWIRRNANLSTGGTATDVTDQVHPSVARHAVDAARCVGLDVAGVDIVAEDITMPLEEQGGGIVEVNAGPGLRMHLEPSAGTPRDVGAAIVDALFPPPETGRIPVIAITGVNGKTTTTRLVAHLATVAGRSVGMTCTDGIYLNGRRTEKRDCSGPHSARSVLLNPTIDFAVLETARGGMLREGVGFDRCHVAVVTNIGKGDHLGLRGIDTIEDLARVKESLVRCVAPAGYAVLNATDPLVANLEPSCLGKVAYFALNQGNEHLVVHRQVGGRVAFTDQGNLVLATGNDVVFKMSLEAIPITHHGAVSFQIENVLAAATAAWCVGLTLDAIREGLASFTGNAEQVPGRFNVFHHGGSTIVVDYAHNPSAVAALADSLGAFSQKHRVLVFSGCNRRDIDLQEMGQTAGDAFDEVILYADWGHGGRADGELNAMLRQGLAKGRRVSQIVEVQTEREAIDRTLASLGSNSLIVLGVEAIEDSLRYVEGRLLEGF